MGTRSSRRRRSAKKLQGPGVEVDRDASYVVFRGIDRGETPDQRRARIREARAAIPGRVRAAAKDIQEFISRYHPLDLLARFSIRNLAIDPETYKEYSHPGRQAYVEYLALVCLSRDFRTETSDWRVITESVLDDLQDRIGRLYIDATWYYGLSEVDTPQSPGASAPSPMSELAFSSVLGQLYVRNNEYRHHLEQVLVEMLQPIDDLLRSEFGFEIQQAVSLARATPRLMGDRYAACLALTQAEEDNLRKLVNALARGHKPDERAIEYPPEVLEELAKMKPKRMKESIRAYAYELGMYGLSDALVFTSSQLAKEAGVDADSAASFLTLMSLEFGSIKDDVVEPHTESPLDLRPIIRLDEAFFCPVPEMPAYQLRRSIEAALKAKGGAAWHRYEECRSKYLESESVRLIGGCLRTDEAYVSLKYIPGTDGSINELDGLILFDSVLMLVECKGGGFGPAARRGAPKSMLSGLKELVVDPHEQTLRAKDYIARTENPEFVTSQGQTIRIDKGRFTRVISIAVTLEPLDAFLPVLARTSELGIFRDADLPWAVYIFDLKVITDLIEFPAQFVHYLQRRLALNRPGTALHVHDELDWFGLYLSRGLYFDHLKGTNFERMGFLSHTGAMDEYYMHQTGLRKTPTPKPRQAMPPVFRKLIEELESLGGDGHVEVICWLLDLGSDARQSFARAFMAARRRAEADGGAHNFTVFVDDKRGITVFAGRDSQLEDFRLHMETYCLAKKYQTRKDEWLGIGSHLSRPGLITGWLVMTFPWEFDEEKAQVVRDFFSSPSG